MSLRKQATSGLIWTFTQQFGNQLISFVVSVLLARLLLPEEFGLVGMILVFYTVGRSLMQSGLTQSLIRTKELDQVDFSTVFYFNIVASGIIYLLVFFLAPLIAEFYNQPILISIVRVYCTIFILDAISSVQRTRLDKAMDFKTQALIAIPSTVIGGVVGISMAYMDYGVWSLVWNAIVTSLVGSIQFWIYSGWTPSLVFSVSKFKEHFSFGYKLTLSGILDKIFSNIYLIIIGRYFSAAQVGYYTRAETMNQLPVNNITLALSKVTFPLFSSIQDDDIRLKSVYKQIMQMVVFVVAPLLIGLAVLAEPTFRFLFTEKWLPAVPYFQILCITGILYPIHVYNINVLKVKGRSDLVLKLELVKKILVIIVIAIVLQYGIFGLLYGQVFLSLVFFFINASYTGRFINYNVIEQTKDIAPIILLSFFCGYLLWLLDDNFFISLNDFPRILIGMTFGGLLYLGLSYFLKLDSFFSFKKIILKQ